MEVKHEQKGDTLIVRVEERKLDTSLAPSLKKEILLLLRNEEIRNLLLTLSAVESIDSSGLGSLLFGRRQMADRGGQCVIIDPQPKVVSLMKIARLDHVFKTFPDEETALNELGT